MHTILKYMADKYKGKIFFFGELFLGGITDAADRRKKRVSTLPGYPNNHQNNKLKT